MSYCWYPGEPLGDDGPGEAVRSLGLSGVEQLLYKAEPNPVHFPKETVGVHLMYWPYWMDFWRDDKKRLAAIFPDKESLAKRYGGTTREEWLSLIRQNMKTALLEEPEYVVWHVAESTDYDAFTYDFHYTNREVLQAAAEVFNTVSDALPETVTVLFENLWWPGLTLLQPEEADYFFSLIERKNVGIMLDTGHMMNTNPDLTSEAGGARYICHTVKRLGSLASLIKGIHLTCSLSGTYQHAFPRVMPDHVDMARIFQHIISIDQHRPFQTAAARQIVNFIKPDYVVHELIGRHIDDPLLEVRQQMKALRMK